MNKFKIQGPYSEDDNAFLYWSNKNGWSDFNSTTLFDHQELRVINFPMEATHIVWVDKNDEIVKTNIVDGFLTHSAEIFLDSLNPIC